MGIRMQDAIKKYRDIQATNRLGGGQKHIDRQHERGKLTARERIEILLDRGSFREVGSCVGPTSIRVDGRPTFAPCDGSVVGTGKVHGRWISLYAPDFTVLGGSTGHQHLLKYVHGLKLAARWGIPQVNLLDSSGGRLGYQDVHYAGIDWMFRLQSLYSGLVPQITVLMGPCIAGGAYLPTLCDFLFMSRVSANLWIAGPRQGETATGEKVDQRIGSADYHMEISGTCDYVGKDDEDAILQCRELIRYLPQNCREKTPAWPVTDDANRETAELADRVPDTFSDVYDMYEVIGTIVDDGEILDIKKDYARRLITCFARFNGEVVGIVANNPKHPGSILEIDSCDKYYRFLQVLDAYNIPLVNVVDTPPVVPGEQQEAVGLIRHIAKITETYATTTVPKISVVLREAYADAGSLIMGGQKGLGADWTFAWPIARFGIEASSVDYGKVYNRGIEDDAFETYLHPSREKVDVFDAAYSSSAQVVDEIIEPKDTRRTIIEALDITRKKKEMPPPRKKMHGTGPT
ncbi:MAG: carboxyl transferase domain-containing protein [Desulfobacterales bacterium]